VAKLVKATCPQCGAGVHVDANAEVVTCAYCGQSSFVERPNRPVTQAQPGYAKIRIEEPPANPAGVVVALLGLVTVAFVGVTVFTCAKRTTSGDGSSFVPSGERVTFGVLAGHVKVADPKHADVTDLLAQARTAIEKTRPGAKLTSCSFFDLKGGTVDLEAGRGDIHHHGGFNFNYSVRDPSKPPGQDVSAGMLVVALYYDEIHVVDTPTPAIVADMQGAIGNPKCSSRDAWASAVKSGMPPDAIATIHLQDHTVFTPASPLIWRFSVEGHTELDRDIDANTCAVLKR
jgi:hypothetical protein